MLTSRFTARSLAVKKGMLERRRSTRLNPMRPDNHSEVYPPSPIFSGSPYAHLCPVALVTVAVILTALNANQARAVSESNNTKNSQFHDRDLYISCYNMVDGNSRRFRVAP